MEIYRSWRLERWQLGPWFLLTAKMLRSLSQVSPTECVLVGWWGTGLAIKKGSKQVRWLSEYLCAAWITPGSALFTRVQVHGLGPTKQVCCLKEQVRGLGLFRQVRCSKECKCAALFLSDCI